MKKLTALLLVLVMVFAMIPMASAAYTSQTIDMTDAANQAKVRFLGRTVADGSKGIRLDWATSGFEFTMDFKGDFKMTCSAQKNAFVLVAIDGEELNVESVKAKRVAVQAADEHREYTFLKNVEAGIHTVRVLRNSDLATNGTTWVESITASCDASTLAPTAQKDLFIEFIGDSITSGCGTILTGQDPEPWNENNHSGPLSYGYQAAQLLDADWALTSKGGIGAWAPASGLNSTKYTMPELYSYVNRYCYFGEGGQPVEWSFSRKPDYVICALGTNDTVNTEHTDQEFYAAMVPFIKTLREKNGDDCKIIFFHNMMSVKHGAMLKILCQQFGGEAEGYYVLKAIKGNSGAIATGAKTGHPGYEDNKKNAELLNTYIGGLQGDVISAKTLETATGTVVAEKDYFVYEDTVLPANVTLDLNGHKLYVADDMTLTAEGSIVGGEIVNKDRVKTASAGTTVDLATTNKVKKFGRLLPDAAGLQVFWPHTAIEFTADFSGDLVLGYDSQLAHSGSATGNLRVFLDNEPSAYINLLKGTDQAVTLLKNVPAGTHTVRIVNESDLDTSGKYVTWKSLKFTGPVDNMQATADKPLYIEYIGDSITSGKGCLGWTKGTYAHMYNSQDLTAGIPTSHSATHSYAYQSAQLLDAEWHIVSRGGAGFVRDDSSCLKVMELMYDYYNPFASSAAESNLLIPYAPTRTPDAIVLALGTNDGAQSPSTTINPWGPVTFKVAAERMIEKLWSRYGKEVPIILQYNMMSGSHEADFATIASEMNAQGGKIYTLKTVKNNDGATSHDQEGIAMHPSANGHAVNAEILADFINNTVLPGKANSQSLTDLLNGVTSGTVTATKNVYVGRETTVPAGVTLNMAGHKLIVADYVDVDANGTWQKATTKARLTVAGTVENAVLPSMEGILVTGAGSLNGLTVPEGYTMLNPAPERALTANSVSLNLNSAIRMNIYADHKFNNTKAIVDGVAYTGTEEGTELRFETEEFNAKNMGDMAEIKMIGEDSAKVAHLGTTVNTSLKKYADYTINWVNWNSSTQAALGRAMVAMLNYGAEAQKFFDYNTGNLVNDTVTPELNAKLQYTAETLPYTDYAGDFSKNDPQSLYYGTACVLASNLKMKVYLQLDSAKGVTATVSYKDYNGHTFVDQPLELTANATPGYYSVAIDDLVAGDVATKITLKIEKGGEPVCTVTDSIAAYASRARQEAANKNAADALMIYGLSARDYFAIQIPQEPDEMPIG